MKHITINAIDQLCRIQKIQVAFESEGDMWESNGKNHGPWACGDYSYGQVYSDHGYVQSNANNAPDSIKVTCPECIKVMKKYGL